MTLDDDLRANLTGNKNSLDKKLSSNVSSILNQSIQFVPAIKPYENVANGLKTKYIHLKSQQDFTPSMNGGSKNTTSMNGETKNTPVKTNGYSAVHPSTSSSYNQDAPIKPKTTGPHVPPAQFQIYPDSSIRLPWDTHLRFGTGVGLHNLGNTCFLNSILQVLTNTPPLVNYLFSGDHEKCACPKGSGYCGLCALRTHIQRVYDSPKFSNSIAPSFIVNKIRCVMKSHQTGRQEDAHEFLRYFVDSMQTAALYQYKDRKLDLFTKETSAISRIFGGFHKNDIICNNCRSISTTFDPFLDLSLEIKQLSNVEAALQHFTRVETLSCDNAYKCPKCNLKVSARKMFTIHQAPNVLTIQLKRFDHMGKVDRHVGFPEKLNVRPYMSEKQGTPVNYKLYGVVVHSGRSTSSGHYYAFVRNPLDQWHLMDDNRVSVARPDQVLSSVAYILFYVRIPLQIAAVKPQAKISAVPTPTPVEPKRIIKPIIIFQKTNVHSVAPLPFVPRSIAVPTTSPAIVQNENHLNGDHAYNQPSPMAPIKINSVPTNVPNGSSFVLPPHLQNSQPKAMACETTNASEPSTATNAADDKDSSPDVDSDKSSRKRHSSSSKRDKSLKETKKKRRKKHHRSKSPNGVDDNDDIEHHRKHKEKKTKKKKRSKKLKHNGDESEPIRKSDEPQMKKFDSPQAKIIDEPQAKKIDTPQTKKFVASQIIKADVVPIKKLNEPVVKNSVVNHNSIRTTLMSPLEFLKLHCASGYGSSVKSWSGEANSVDRNGHADKRTYDDVVDELWNEDFDRGKVKKLKLDRNSNNFNSKISFKINGNAFQRVQNAKNFNDRK